MAKKLKKRADGRLQRKIVLGRDFNTGKTITKTVYGYTMQELEKKTAALLAQYEHIDYNDLTVEQYIRSYIDQRKKDLIGDNGLNTIESYEATLRLYVTPIIGKYRLTNINTPMLRDLINNITPKRVNCTGRRTKQYVHTCLNLIFNRAFKDSLISHNPMLAIDKPKHVQEERGVMDISHVNKFIATVKKDNEQLARLFDVLFDSATRRSEIIALKYIDINFSKCTVSIVRSIKNTATKGLIENEPKTKNSKRIIVLSQYSMSVLAEQRKYAIRKVRESGQAWSDDYHVFIDDKLQPFKPNYITRTFTKYRRELGLPDNVSLHSLRHTCATMLSEADISPKKIQLRLGHSSAAFTLDRYNHNTVNMQQSVADTLNDLRNKSSQ